MVHPKNMEDIIILVLPFVFGAVVGSFLNVCIYRIPLGLSLVSPPSRCSSCGKQIPFYFNIPLLGYIFLGGKCYYCKASFSIRYPIVEALTGLFAALLFNRYGVTAELFVYFALVSSLIVITFIDLDHKIIPDVISLPGIVVGFGASFFLDSPGVLDSGIGIVLGGGILFAIAAAYLLLTGKDGMGGGDIKLLAMIGAFVGWKGVIVTLFFSSFIGAVSGIAFMAVSGKGRKYAIPFGPFLASGALIYLFYGDFLINWYIMKAMGE